MLTLLDLREQLIRTVPGVKNFKMETHNGTVSADKTKEFFNFGSYYLQCMQSRVILKNSMQRVLILRKRYIADEEKRNCDCD